MNISKGPAKRDKGVRVRWRGAIRGRIDAESSQEVGLKRLSRGTHADPYAESMLLLRILPAGCASIDLTVAVSLLR